MKIIHTADQLVSALDAYRDDGKSIGLVPTMGALHKGHVALIRASHSAGHLTVATVFVNPTQFNEQVDLEAYPVTPREDEYLLERSGCDILFRPSVEEVYPSDIEVPVPEVDFGGLTERLEGAHRSGHFAGVAQVVARLLDLVAPDVLYLGQKDYQQVAVVSRLVEASYPTISVTTVPTVREPDGLAMSSRNRRLSPDERRAAGKINLNLAAVAAGLRAGWAPRQLEQLAVKHLSSVKHLRPEYLEVVNGQDLSTYDGGEPSGGLVVLTAVWAGPVRLIDNRIAIAANP